MQVSVSERYTNRVKFTITTSSPYFVSIPVYISISTIDCSRVLFGTEMGIFDDVDPETTLVLYPSADSLDMRSEESVPRLKALRRLIVVDSTCIGAKKIMRHPVLKSLPSVRLESRHTYDTHTHIDISFT